MEKFTLRNKERTEEVLVVPRITVMKIALDYVYVGGHQPLIVLVRYLIGDKLLACLFDTPSQELLNQFNIITASKPIKPFWLDFSKIADSLGSGIKEHLITQGYDVVDREDFMQSSQGVDFELYTTTKLTELILQTLVTDAKITIYYLTPHDYHLNINPFIITPVSFANSEHNEMVQGVNSVLTRFKRLREKLGTRIYAHPSYERMLKELGTEEY